MANSTDDSTTQQLWDAIYNLVVPAIKALLDAGADVDARTWSGNSPLHETALRGAAEAVKLLLDKGADPTIRSCWANAAPTRTGVLAQIKQLLTAVPYTQLRRTLPMRTNEHKSQLLLIFCMLVTSPAHAQTLGQALCGVISNNETALSAIASLGIILLGIAATLGKVTWKQALLVIVGSATFFGASAIAFSIASMMDVDGNGYWTVATDRAIVVTSWCQPR